MRVGFYRGLQSLIISLAFLPSFAFAERPAWSDVGLTFDKDRLSVFNGKKNDKDSKQCNISIAGMEEDGDKGKGGQYEKQSLGNFWLIVHKGADVENKAYGRWEYGYKINFKAPEKYKKPILSALKNALASGNCDLANYFANMLVNGKEKQTPDGKNGFVYEDDHENGTSCVVLENGEAQCRRHYLMEDNPDGTKRICITPDSQSGCHEDFSMEELSKKNNKKDDKSNNSGSSDGKGNSSHNKDGGLDGSDNGTGSGDSGNGSGNGKGGKGDGSGDGSGKGNGKGVGDKEGDGDKDKTEDIEIKAAPSMKEVFSGLRDKIKDKFLKDFEISNAQCPTVQFSLLNRTFTIDQHCNILESIREFMQSLMMFLYTFAAIRVVLSA